jgi:hypothetical protein
MCKGRIGSADVLQAYSSSFLGVRLSQERVGLCKIARLVRLHRASRGAIVGQTNT